LQIMVFFMPQGATMPLHDHPGMTVFTKLLVGSAHVVSYDWARPRVCAAGSVPGAMLAEKVVDEGFTTAASGPWVLFPDGGGNLHRLMTGEDGPCALIDVITPRPTRRHRRRSSASPTTRTSPTTSSNRMLWTMAS
ncbi:hypothetical protein BAE44_0004131, partial [Dichanthelium oligosanthes]